MSHKILMGCLTIFAVFASSASALAFAGDGSGAVEIEHVGFGTRVYFYTTTHTNAPACNTYRQRWVLSLAAAEGKGMYAFLLAAQLNGKEVKVWGTGTCDIEGNTESVAAVGSVVDYSQHP